MTRGCARHAVALLLLAYPGALRAEGEVGVLPVAGAPELDRELERVLAERCGPTVLSAARTLSRISQGRIGPALEELRRKLARAEDAALRMKREAAVSSAGEAVEGLQKLAAAYHAPALLARAWLTQGFALLLRPADEEGALAAFRAAAGIDPGTRPDPDRLPPRAARMLERAQANKLGLPAPTASQLALLAEGAGLSKIAWATFAGDPGAEVQVLTYDRSAHTLRTGTRPLRQDRRQLARSLIQAGALCSDRPARVAVPVEQPATRPAPVSRPPRRERARPLASPWHRRWWIWGIASAVLVGTSVAVAVATSRGRYELHLRY